MTQTKIAIFEKPKSPKTTDLVKIYLNEIGKIRLLVAEEEILLGKQVQEMAGLLRAKKTLSKKLERECTNSEWANCVSISESQLNQILKAGLQAKKKMIEANLRLVVEVAKRYQNRGVELPDLFQEGAIGLTRAVEKFDPSKGYKFSTYAYHWIRQGITRAIGEKSRTIRLPIHITEKLNKIKKSHCRLAQELGRTATAEEIGSTLKMTVEEVKKYLGWIRGTVSLDVKVGDRENTELLEILPADCVETPDEPTLSAGDLNYLLAHLTSQEREVLILRFGLAGEEQTFKQISQKLNLSRERIRQIEIKALRRLQFIASNLQ